MAMRDAVVSTDVIAGKSTPTGIAINLWERACPRWRPCRHYI